MPCLGGERQVGLAPHAVEAVVDDLVGFVYLGAVAIVVGSVVLEVGERYKIIMIFNRLRVDFFVRS